MSKRRKKNSVNPAKAAQEREEAGRAYEEFMAFMKQTAEDGMDKVLEDLQNEGASDASVEQLIRMMRCRVAYEALEAGDVDGFERITAPIADALDVMGLFDKAEELGMEGRDDA